MKNYRTRKVGQPIRPANISGFQNNPTGTVLIQPHQYFQRIPAKRSLQGFNRFSGSHGKYYKLYYTRLTQIAHREGHKLLASLKTPTNQRNLIYGYNFVQRVDNDEGDFTAAGYALPSLALFTGWQAEQDQALTELGNQTFQSSISDTILGMGGSEDDVSAVLGNIDNDYINFLLTSHSYPSSENTMAFFQNRISNILTDGYANGSTASIIGDNISSLLSPGDLLFPAFIFDRTARNESTRFMNEGKLYSWQQVGIKQYNWRQGPGPCTHSDICSEMADGAPYIVGDGPMPIDDTHINCLCEIEEIIEGNIFGGS